MDFVTDQSCRHLNRISSLLAVPDFVKQSYVDQESVGELNSHQFADPVHREFPIDDQGHVYLSYAYAKSAGVDDSRILKRITRAGELFGVTEEFGKIDAAFGTCKQAAAPTPEFAISFSMDTGVRNIYPLNTPLQVEDSAVKMANAKPLIPLPLWYDGCQNIVKAAATFGLDAKRIPRIVREYGEDRLIDIPHVKFAAAQRVKETGDAIYEVLADAIEADDSTDMEKYAELWLQTDLQNGVVYRGDIEDPYRIIFSGSTIKEASAVADKYFTLAGAAVPVSALKGLTKEALDKNFPEKVAKDYATILKMSSGLDVESVVSGHDDNMQKQLLQMLLDA